MSSSSRSFAARRTAAGGALALAALLGSAGATPGAPAHVLRYITDAQPAGSGRLTWFGLHVYDAQLYIPARGFDATAISAQPFALALTYARALDGQAIAERSRDEIARLGLGTDGQRRRWLREMAALFPDVRSGQTISGIHLPGAETRFYLDGRPLGRIEDPEFGPAFFAIWLDPRTREPALRARLLQRAATPDVQR